MPDARDIMNKSPRPDAAASTEIRAFRETFGTSLPIVSMVWSMLWEEDVVRSPFPQGLSPTGPGVCSCRLVCRRRRREDPQKVGLGVYRRHRGTC